MVGVLVEFVESDSAWIREGAEREEEEVRREEGHGGAEDDDVVGCFCEGRRPRPEVLQMCYGESGDSGDWWNDGEEEAGFFVGKDGVECNISQTRDEEFRGGSALGLISQRGRNQWKGDGVHQKSR